MPFMLCYFPPAFTQTVICTSQYSLLPCSGALQEVHLTGGGYYLGEVASALGVKCLDVLYHGKVGRQQTAYIPPEEVPQNMDGSNLLVGPAACTWAPCMTLLYGSLHFLHGQLSKALHWSTR